MKSIKLMKSVKVNKANEISSMVIKGARTELAIFFNCVLRKQKELKRREKTLCFNYL